jgi:hypothetical protein
VVDAAAEEVADRVASKGPPSSNSNSPSSSKLRAGPSPSVGAPTQIPVVPAKEPQHRSLEDAQHATRKATHWINATHSATGVRKINGTSSAG